ncbi:repressor phrH2, partial [Halorubrum sp. SP3]
MRDSVPWMGGLDERILERLAGDGDADAWEIAFDIRGRVSQSRVSDR